MSPRNPRSTRTDTLSPDTRIFRSGYTLLFVAVTSAINQTLYKNITFDLTKDFAPVALGAKVPNILVVNPKVPVKSVKELVDYAQANPRSEEHTSELQSLMRTSYAVSCLKKKQTPPPQQTPTT